VKQSNISKLFCLCALVVTFVLVGTDLVITAQNSNDTTMQNTNDNTGATSMSTGRHRRRRGRRRRATPAAPPAAEATGTTMAGPGSALGRVGETASLDGTYTGTVNYPDGGLTGDGTLAITGNTFTLNGQSGTLTTQQWPGYIAVSLRFGTDRPAKIVSTRARKNGSWLTLTSVPGEMHQFSFRGTSGATTGTGGGGHRRRGRRRRAAATAPAETTAPGAEAAPTTSEPAAPATGRRRRRGRRRGAGNTNMNSNMGDNTNNSNMR